MTVGCPVGDKITIVTVGINVQGDASETTHSEYKWTDDDFQSPNNSIGVTFQAGVAPIVNLYNKVTGQQGGNLIPTNNSVITIGSDKKINDTYTFNANSDRFRYLRSDTLYNNTTTEIQALLVASTDAGAPTPPTNGNSAYTATFNMPSTGQYLYLIWDYRDVAVVDLCYDSSTSQAACCDCEDGANIYVLQDCNSGAQFTIEDTYQNGIGIGSVVQYVQGVGAGAGTFVYCGTIINFGVTPNATLHSNVTQTCGDVVNCDFESSLNCTQYTVSTYSGTGQGYSYTDCNGVFRSEFIGGASGYDADTFCALTGSVDPGSNNLYNEGDCSF